MKKQKLTTKEDRIKTKRGFTLVEVMIAVGLFVSIMLVGVGAALNTNFTHKRTLAVRQVLDSVNFLVEDMARSLRLGYNYRCGIDGNYTLISSYEVQFDTEIDNPKDCQDSFSLAFEHQDGDSTDESDQVAYIISPGNSIDSAKIQKIFGGSIRNITPDTLNGEAKLTIDPRQSGFTVIGSLPFPTSVSSDPSTTDTLQPRVIIRISGFVDYKNNRVPFAIQTTVTQRLIDS